MDLWCVYICRILYGKMQSQTGKDSSGKFNSNFRKATVMKFLAGSKQEELKVFIDLILQPIQHLVGGENNVTLTTLIYI